MTPLKLFVAALCLSQSACIANIIDAVRKGDAHGDMEEAVSAAAARGEAALSAGDTAAAVAAYEQALAAALEYHYRFNFVPVTRRREGVTDVDMMRAMVADSDVVAKALTRLVTAYRAVEDPARAAGVANVLPEERRKASLADLGLTDATVPQARTAPSRVVGQLVSWSGEITQVRYDEPADRLRMEVTPVSYTREQKGWTRRNVVGPGGSRWETVPNWVLVKHLRRGQAFVAEVAGYDRQLVRGRFVRLYGRIAAESTSRRLVLEGARPAKVLERPRGALVSVLGVACREPWSDRCRPVMAGEPSVK